ncbi:hypothetical protein C2S52_009421 [Perilla frutescens var. hirtella]|uniref:Homeobox-leucine zipper protein n=1 Tax=Perilla frutescens var. hirtella TaxID=608512 RepID=A0AAD4P1D7_PERFH|nr:hypothetical protein C2S51_017084 [Perilla frutescens var. frutescens]KAH6784462.1 hypothetical protein C2S52_009421 [Perilla frutescens var. hirtella]KAH6822596.1 hypothetical protein C2S53_013954 [Perilla frutescens var. hirtella]
MLEGLDEEGCVEESGHISEKKRRLSVDQVKALEKNFEVENKLEPERKVKLAQELGLQPRQVAVWFQNRRARWKTKQLERDYGIRELKSKFNGSDGGKIAVKEEASLSDTEEKCDLEIHDDGAAIEMNIENCDVKENEMIGGASVFGDFKDGSSDSDSSAILNEDNNSPIAAAISSSGGILRHSPHRFLDVHGGGGLTNSAMNANFVFSESKASILGDANKIYQAQFVKIEEHNFFGEESCSTLFSDDQPPTLHWYCNDEWN